jgi:hypothetical protein
LAQVRLHDHAAAGAAARSIDARAFTLGADIAFAPGEYAPGTTEGRRLLAHELAHVVQQAGTPAASRLMRQPYPGCDRRTTGVDDAETRIDDARVEAVFMAGVASEASARLDSWTIRLADRHFHCPSSSEIGSLRTTFATIRTNIMALDPRCLRKSDPKCRDALAWVSSDGMLEICPIAFAAETASETLSGTFIWGGAINAGKDKGCKWGSPCYDDFTVPASDMMKHADAFEEFALELAGHVHGYPETIPCRPRNTHMSVLVPPDAVRNPALIRPVSGFDPSPPPGLRVVPVWEDSDGQRFIYSDTLPGAKAYLPKEPKRFYLPSHLRWGR